jgi:hypothetical protein
VPVSVFYSAKLIIFLSNITIGTGTCGKVSLYKFSTILIPHIFSELNGFLRPFSLQRLNANLQTSFLVIPKYLCSISKQCCASKFSISEEKTGFRPKLQETSAFGSPPIFTYLSKVLWGTLKVLALLKYPILFSRHSFIAKIILSFDQVLRFLGIYKKE